MELNRADSIRLLKEMRRIENLDPQGKEAKARKKFFKECEDAAEKIRWSPFNDNEYFKWDYDQEHDCLYIKFKTGKDYARSVDGPDNCNCMIDLDKDAMVTGVEITDFRRGKKKKRRA